MADGQRVDVLLHRLRITRSRNEAKSACDAGAIRVNGTPARPSQNVVPGQVLAVRFPTRLLEVELVALPGKSLSKPAAREHYRVLRDEPTPDDA